MPVYRLEPTSEDSADWQVSEYKGPVIVRAENENSARDKVAVSDLGYIESLKGL